MTLIRFATWNLRDGGIDVDGSETRRIGQLALLREMNCDVLALQETTGWHQHDWSRLYEGADALGLVPLPPLTSRIGDGHNHQALLVNPRTVRVTNYTGDRGRQVFHHGLIRARLVIADTEVTVLATHLSWTDGDTRLQEASWLTDYAGEIFGERDTAVLLGDLNTIDPADDEPDWEQVPANLQRRYRLARPDGSFGPSDRRAARILLQAGWANPHPSPPQPTVGHAYANEPLRLRLDYTLLTDQLLPHVKAAWTRTEDEAGHLSDHLPTGFDLHFP